MELSIFLAKVFGLFFLVMGFAVIVNKEAIKKGVTEIFAGAGSLLLFGILTLLIGIMVVLSHPVWVTSWPVIITLLGYLLVINGVIRVAYPEFARKLFKFFSHSESFKTLFLILLLLGVCLTYHGFSAV